MTYGHVDLDDVAEATGTGVQALIEAVANGMEYDLSDDEDNIV